MFDYMDLKSTGASLSPSGGGVSRVHSAEAKEVHRVPRGGDELREGRQGGGV